MSEIRGSGVISGDGDSGSIFSGESMLGQPEMFERFPYGLVLVDREGTVVSLNREARQLLAHESSVAHLTCCDLVCCRIGHGLGDVCLTRRALDADSVLPEIRVDFEGVGSQVAAWVTASALSDDRSHLVLHLRPGIPDDRRRRNVAQSDSKRALAESPTLQIHTLGRFRIETDGAIAAEDWIEQRPGQLLKYLVCQRGRVVTSDQIANSLWPDAGPEEALSRVRYYVHVLREKLEPNRPKRSASHFVIARGGGYGLNAKHVAVDADDFEREVRAGLTEFVQDRTGSALAHLERAMRLYHDEFLPGDLYEEWSLDERDRLRELASRALRALIHINLKANELSGAADHARRLAEMEPFDSDVQRTFIDICLRRGRRTEAMRRYAVLRKRMLRSFGEEPDFDLSEIGE
jgi:DNA-binding SARP family transcriptional activator